MAFGSQYAQPQLCFARSTTLRALQDGTRVEKERQRNAGRVQQLQAELTAMRSQQDSLRQRLQDRLTAQEKDAAAKARELASLRRAGEREVD